MGPHNDLMLLQMTLQLAQIHEIEAKLQQPSVYEPVAETLILYCQSDPTLLPHDLGPAWFPAELRKQGGFRASVNADRAYIEFGGGFYHFGYSLRRDQAASTPQLNVWQLFMCREETEDKQLCTKSVATTRRFSAAEMLKQVLGSYDEFLAAQPSNEDVHKSKIAVLLKFDKVPEARAACKAMLEKLPDDWWANTVCALAIAGEKSDAEAERFLAAWIKRNPNFDNYLDVAYYYQLRGQTKKAASAILKATEYDAGAAQGHGYNSQCRGYAAALYACRSGEYDAAIKLCDKLLPVKTNGDFAKRALRELKAAAEKLAKGEKATVTSADEMDAGDLLDRAFVEKLLERPTEQGMR
jgi:tetratricopeptide (TPR) repeat protein